MGQTASSFVFKLIFIALLLSAPFAWGQEHAPAVAGHGSATGPSDAPAPVYIMCYTYASGTMYTTAPTHTTPEQLAKADSRAQFPAFVTFIAKQHGAAGAGRCFAASTPEEAVAALPKHTNVVRTDWRYSPPSAP